MVPSPCGTFSCPTRSAWTMSQTVPCGCSSSSVELASCSSARGSASVRVAIEAVCLGWPRCYWSSWLTLCSRDVCWTATVSVSSRKLRCLSSFDPLKEEAPFSCFPMVPAPWHLCSGAIHFPGFAATSGDLVIGFQQMEGRQPGLQSGYARCQCQPYS